MDREQGGADEAKKNDMELFSVVPMKTRGFSYLEGAMPPEQYKFIEMFLKDSICPMLP